MIDIEFMIDIILEHWNVTYHIIDLMQCSLFDGLYPYILPPIDGNLGMFYYCCILLYQHTIESPAGIPSAVEVSNGTSAVGYFSSKDKRVKMKGDFTGEIPHDLMGDHGGKNIGGMGFR